MIDNQDKDSWCRVGEKQEREFVVDRLFRLGIGGFVNTEKIIDPFTHDLQVMFKSDLKSVRTPLFKAQELYGLDPQYTVTFNDKDAVRYRKYYPNIVVFFDVNWSVTSKEIKGHIYTVQPMHETYAGFLDDISRAVKDAGSLQHAYRQRVDDASGNAKSSWVFDVRKLHKLKEPLKEKSWN